MRDHYVNCEISLYMIADLWRAKTTVVLSSCQALPLIDSSVGMSRIGRLIRERAE